jgi:hypothetical protein
MTTLYQEEVRCAVCREVNTFTDIGSTNAFGSPDLGSIHAAWACDDAANPQAATRCRLQAVGLIRRVHEQNLTLAEQPGADQAMLTDLLRRAGRWEEALDVVDQSIAGIDNEFIRSVLRYEKALIVRGDLEVHRKR